MTPCRTGAVREGLEEDRSTGGHSHRRTDTLPRAEILHPQGQRLKGEWGGSRGTNHYPHFQYYRTGRRIFLLPRLNVSLKGFSVGRYSLEEDFDFWGHLIDHKPHCETEKPIRKGSFVTISSESSSEYERAPFKRVKSDSSPLSPSLSSLP
jgi:hypothetical protein